MHPELSYLSLLVDESFYYAVATERERTLNKRNSRTNAERRGESLCGRVRGTEEGDGKGLGRLQREPDVLVQSSANNVVQCSADRAAAAGVNNKILELSNRCFCVLTGRYDTA